MWRRINLPTMGLSDLEDDTSTRDEGSCWLSGSGELVSTPLLWMDAGCSVCWTLCSTSNNVNSWVNHLQKYWGYNLLPSDPWKCKYDGSISRAGANTWISHFKQDWWRMLWYQELILTLLWQWFERFDRDLQITGGGSQEWAAVILPYTVTCFLCMEVLLEVDMAGPSPHALRAGDTPDLIPQVPRIRPHAD